MGLAFVGRVPGVCYVSFMMYLASKARSPVQKSFKHKEFVDLCRRKDQVLTLGMAGSRGSQYITRTLSLVRYSIAIIVQIWRETAPTHPIRATCGCGQVT